VLSSPWKGLTSIMALWLRHVGCGCVCNEPMGCDHRTSRSICWRSDWNACGTGEKSAVVGLCGKLGRGDGGSGLVDATSCGDCGSWSDSSWKLLSVPEVFVPV